MFAVPAHMRLVSLFVVASVALLSTPSWAEKPHRLLRSEKGFRRDVKRLTRIPGVASLSNLLDAKSKFTGRLLPKGQAPWRELGEGAKTFNVDLGHGCQLQGSRYALNFPKVNKLTGLKIVKNGKTHDLMANVKLPVLLDYDTSFQYEGNQKVSWHGPESRFAVLSLLHELGHTKDLAAASPTKQLEITQAYDKRIAGKVLTSAEHRTIIGFERSAWANALKEARTLKRQGVDLFGGASNKEVMNTVYGCLKGYYDYKGPAAK